MPDPSHSFAPTTALDSSRQLEGVNVQLFDPSTQERTGLRILLAPLSARPQNDQTVRE
ncbi:MAG TPA: hypothetical protein VFB21_01160 [Chthonomonadaceae bacterium]|nr:hypothetical protein [Chthonomonadaceae bacterium]